MKLLIKEQFNKFTNEEGYRIITATILEIIEGDYKNKSITVTGNIPKLSKNEQLLVIGDVEHHKKYGASLKVSSYERPIPKTKEQIIAFLSSSMFTGIGKKIAELIYEELGNRAIELIGKKGAEALKPIRINQDKKELIVKVIQENYLLNDIIKFYAEYGIKAEKVIRLHQLEGGNINIKENPYLFAKHGLVDFRLCDKIALENGKLPHNFNRLEVAFELLLKEETRNGHCYIDEDMLIKRILHYLNSRVKFEDHIFESIICDALYKSNVCMAEHGLVYPKALFYAETTLANHVAKRINVRSSDYDYVAVERAIQSLNSTATDEQKQAIHGFMQNDIFILTGEPGAGKTFTIDLMLQVAKILNPKAEIALTAPTGRAAKRIMESLNVDGTASTLHRLLGYGMNGKGNVPYYNEKNPLNYDIFISDEFSMCDMVLAKNLLDAMKQGSKICICGDINQLESVGAGSVLKDLLQTSVPYTHLSKVFRQSEKSLIHLNAQRIKKGEMIYLTNHPSQYFIETPTPNIPNYVVASIKKLMKQGVDINDIMVLAPMKAGISGTIHLNHVIKELVNPKIKGKRELSLGTVSFREGDKVMCLINDSENNVFNGDIGYVKRINTIDHELLIDFDGNIVKFKRKDMLDLTLAYSSSIHKAQGSEYPYVISIYSDEHLPMLKRNLILTGLTRAKQVNIIIGQSLAVQQAIFTVDKENRRTSLTKLINSKTRQVSYQLYKIM